jgi:S-adenosylmethionine/arginine decarboxylase-like enzyme
LIQSFIHKPLTVFKDFKMSEEKYWGYHLHLDCSGCDSESIKSYQTIYDFSKELVITIDMVPYGEPQIVNFGSGDKEGYTLIQLIETSNIAAHFVNENNHIYLDVFSCKNFDQNVVKQLVKKYFGAKKMKKTFLRRQAPE